MDPMWKTLFVALAPLAVGIGGTALVASRFGPIVDFLFGGPATAGWQQAVVVGILFLPIGLTLIVVEYGIRRHSGADSSHR